MMDANLHDDISNLNKPFVCLLPPPRPPSIPNLMNNNDKKKIN